MKSIIFAALTLFTMTAQAQTEQKALVESKSYDNWYIGINGGVATKSTHNRWIDNINGNGGVRIGRWFTPAFGLAVEGNVYGGSKPYQSTGTFITYLNTNLVATVNLSNWFFGYKGKPRFFELIALPGAGIGHVFGSKSTISKGMNDFVGKFALDFAFNVNKARSLQFYVEPAVLYSIYGNTPNNDKLRMDFNRSFFQVNVGLVYKFKNSNGTHNFRYAEPQYITDYDELNRLNARLADLQDENERLRNRPAPQAKTEIVEKRIIIKAGIDPVVSFAQGSSRVERSQLANIEKVASYLKQNGSLQLTISGYASTEGTAQLNQKLSEARAEAVKHTLVSRYGVSANRITTQGNGATAEQSSTRAHNRVAVFSIVE